MFRHDRRQSKGYLKNIKEERVHCFDTKHKNFFTLSYKREFSTREKLFLPTEEASEQGK